MNEKKTIKKAFYFGYGNDNFGEDRDLSTPLKGNLDANEGYGIALIAGKHINFKSIGKTITIKLKNDSANDVLLRVEKKFYNDVKTGFEMVNSNSTKDVTLELADEDLDMKELVVALLRVDNTEKTHEIHVSFIVEER